MTAATSLETRLVRSVEYHVGGEGDVILLVHGLGGSAENWVEVVPELVRRHRVIAIDLPGHAGSAALARGATMDDFAGTYPHDPNLPLARKFSIAAQIAQQDPAAGKTVPTLASGGSERGRVPRPRRTSAASASRRARGSTWVSIR